MFFSSFTDFRRAVKISASDRAGLRIYGISRERGLRKQREMTSWLCIGYECSRFGMRSSFPDMIVSRDLQVSNPDALTSSDLEPGWTLHPVASHLIVSTNITPMEQACWLLRMRREDFAKMGMSSGTGTSLHRKLGFGFVCDLWTLFYQMPMHEGSSMPPLNWSP